MRALLLIVALLGPIEAIDHQVQRTVQGWRQPPLDRTARAISDLGRPVVVLGGLLAIAVLDPTAGVTTARLALATLIPTNLAVESLKRGVFRTRPDGERKRSNASFPSSHAANAFAIAAVLARRWRRAGSLLWLFAALVAASRVFLNRHYLSDVAVGAAIGILSAWLIHRLWLARAPGGSSRRRS